MAQVVKQEKQFRIRRTSITPRRQRTPICPKRPKSQSRRFSITKRQPSPPKSTKSASQIKNLDSSSKREHKHGKSETLNKLSSISDRSYTEGLRLELPEAFLPREPSRPSTRHESPLIRRIRQDATKITVKSPKRRASKIVYKNINGLLNDIQQEFCDSKLKDTVSRNGRTDFNLNKVKKKALLNGQVINKSEFLIKRRPKR